MEPATGSVVNFFGNSGREADDVVIECLFEFTLAADEAGQVGEPLAATGFDPGKVLRGNDPLLYERGASEEFDLQPNLQLVFVRPNSPHFRPRVARNHCVLDSRQRHEW